MSTLITYFSNNCPFRFSDNSRLISLSLGVVAGPDDKVNCDCADEIGWDIHKQLNGRKFTLAKLHRTDKIKTLSDMVNVCKVGGDRISLDPNILFSHLVLMAERTGRTSEYFAFELTSVPMSLFKNGYIRKPDKPSLYRKSVGDFNKELLPCPARYVVDGGYLLCKVRWCKGSTFFDIMKTYVGLLRTKVGCAPVIVVFDGYLKTPYTKDHEHKRQASRITKIAPEIAMNLEMTLNFEQDAFLANSVNKQHFTELLIPVLRQSGINARQSHADADTDIVSCALEMAELIKLPGIAEELTPMLNTIYASGNAPETFRRAAIVPIPKKGDLSQLGNWRGISLMSLLAKLYNRVLLNRLRPVLDPLLRKNQNGFRPGRGFPEHILCLSSIE